MLQAQGDDIVVTTDAIVEGVHFLADDPADTIARKALRVNLSDLAAKGATPAGFVLTLALRSRTMPGSAVRRRARRGRKVLRLSAARRRHGVDAGSADDLDHRLRPRAEGQDGPSRAARSRGDRIVVTGTIGDAALGLDILKGGAVATALRRRCSGAADAGRPLSRAAAAQCAGGAVRDHATAAMDVSDGLAGDLAKLCAASGVSAAIDVPGMPLSRPAAAFVAQRGIVSIETLHRRRRRLRDPVHRARGDFEAFAQEARRAGVAVTAIGTVIAGSARRLSSTGRAGNLR